MKTESRLVYKCFDKGTPSSKLGTLSTSCSITCSHQSADATSYFVILENYKKESLNKELQQNRCCIQALLAAMAQNHAEQGL